jgi:hypothetical protein
MTPSPPREAAATTTEPGAVDAVGPVVAVAPVVAVVDPVFDVDDVDDGVVPECAVGDVDDAPAAVVPGDELEDPQAATARATATRVPTASTRPRAAPDTRAPDEALAGKSVMVCLSSSVSPVVCRVLHAVNGPPCRPSGRR